MHHQDESESGSHHWRAHWIWTAPHGGPRAYQHASFRKTFKLEVVSATARALVAADTFYRLWVNGCFVMHGPARTAHGQAVYDDLEVARHLQAGQNVLAVEVIYVDVGIFDALPQAPGLLVELVSDQGEVLSGVATDGTWKTAPVSFYTVEAPRFSVQRGFVEIADGRKLAAQWNCTGFDDQAWPAARQIGPVGTPPWKTLVPRDTPLPAAAIVRPSTVRSVDGYDGLVHGDVIAGSREQTWHEDPERFYGDVPFYEGNLRALLHTELPLPCGAAVDGALSDLCRDADAEVLIAPGDCDPAVTFDFGANQAGFAFFELSAESGTVIDLVWAERSFADGHIRPRLITCNNFLRYITSDGRQRFEAFHPQTFRFAKLIVRRGGRPVTLHRVGLREYCYRDVGGAAFTCSDPLVQNVWDAARRTCILNTDDGYLDCPSRERAAWFHDGYWTALGGFFLLGEEAINRRMLQLAAHTQGVFPQWPGMVGSCVGGRHPDTGRFYLGHALFYVLQVWLDAELTGSRALGRALAPCIVRLMQTLETWRNTEGLLEAVPGSPFLDYSDVSHVDSQAVPVALNALYVRALEAASRLTDDARYVEQAGEIRSRLDQLAWDDQSGVYVDALVRENGRLVKSSAACESTQYMVLWAQVPQPERSGQLWALLRDVWDQPHDRQRRVAGGRLTPANLYGFFERAEVAFRFGEHARILEDLRRRFGPMTAEAPNTLWEVFDPGDHYSRCHGLSSAVGAFLSRDYLGIRPGRDGLADAVVAPHPAGMDWARGHLATSQGRMGVEWQRDGQRWVLLVVPVSGGTVTVHPPDEARVCVTDRSVPNHMTIKTPTRLIFGPDLRVEAVGEGEVGL